MEISFIGTGKAAFNLAKYFKEKGHNIKYAFDIDNEKVEEFSSKFLSKIVSIETLTNDSDMVFLTVNDNMIYELWEKIKSSTNKKSTIYIHCSGAKKGLYENEEYHLHSLHPAAPLTGNSQLTNICFGLEDSGMYKDKIKNFIENMGNRVFLIPKEKKSQYHLANVIVSNLVLSLFEKGTSYLLNCGLNEEEAIALLMPLANENLQNIFKKGIKDSVTGPVSRGDYEVCKSHLEVINKEDEEVYTLLSKNILKILGKDKEEFDINIK